MTTTYVSVSVPEHLLKRVYALILETPVHDQVSGAASAGAPVPGNGIWHQHELHDLGRRLKNPTGRAVMTCVAEKSLNGTAATYEELRAAGEAAGDATFGYDNLRAQLSWISKYSIAIRDGGNEWPIEVVDGGADRKQGERYRYRMPAEVAGWWLEAMAS